MPNDILTKRTKNRDRDNEVVLYNLAVIAEKLRTSSMPYTYDIAEGNVPDHEGFEAFSAREAVAVAGADVWTGTADTIPIPADAGVQMEVISSDAKDAGVAIYDSAATGGSATTLIDTDENFTAGDVVEVGDVILLDDDGGFGCVTTVAATVLTCAAGFFNDEGAVTPASGNNYRVVDINAGGVGVQVIEVHCLDETGATFEEFIIMNGLAAGVAFVEATTRFINEMHAVVVGAEGDAAGNIIAYFQGAAATIYIQIRLGENVSLSSQKMIPLGKTFYLTQWGATSSGNKRTDIELLITARHGVLFPRVFMTRDVAFLEDSVYPKPFDVPVKIPALAIIKVFANPVLAGAYVSANWSGWIEDED